MLQGFECMTLGVLVICIPVVWKLRRRAAPMTGVELRTLVRFIRITAVPTILISILIAAHGSDLDRLEGMTILLFGTTAILLAVPIGRVFLGGEALDVSTELRRLYWRATTMIGLANFIAGTLLIISRMIAQNIGK